MFDLFRLVPCPYKLQTFMSLFSFITVINGYSEIPTPSFYFDAPSPLPPRNVY